MSRDVIRVEQVGEGEQHLMAGSRLLMKNLYSRPGGFRKNDDDLAREGMLTHFWGVDQLSNN